MCIRTSLVVVLAASVPACDTEKGGGSSTSLDGRHFIDGTLEGRTLVEGTSVSVGFYDGEISASAGCNSMSGAYSIANGQLHVSNLGTTEIGCSSALHEQDQWLATFMTSSPSLELDEPRLVLSDGEVTLTLIDREVADPDRPLAGPAWELNGFIENDGFSFGDWPQTVLKFGEGGSFAIDLGCPTASGNYTVEGNSIVFVNVSMDLNECPAEPQYAVDVATTVLSDGTSNYEIDAGHLTLMRGEQGLSFYDPA